MAADGGAPVETIHGKALVSLRPKPSATHGDFVLGENKMKKSLIKMARSSGKSVGRSHSTKMPSDRGSNVEPAERHTKSSEPAGGKIIAHRHTENNKP